MPLNYKTSEFGMKEGKYLAETLEGVDGKARGHNNTCAALQQFENNLVADLNSPGKVSDSEYAKTSHKQSMEP